MNMLRPTLLAVLTLLLAFSPPSQAEESMPPEVAAFIPAGFQPLRYQANDFNNDDRLDGLLMLHGKGKERPVLLLLRGDDDKLTLAARNDHAILPKGWFSDPFQEISIGTGWFSLAHKLGNQYFRQRFYWSRTKQTWLLGEVMLVAPGNIRTFSGDRVSPVSFADFSPLATLPN
ncbi:hypothetical protein [Vogesella indigofera]|uniref:hypothetical protein n=1 Tax=Vogesella indigofera TaxID=45465 RepID=UPI00234EE826|nr:hypothetical protein [Vogesella indigofera]MDC7711119.1 hypothetical protein [Vogesella indigofera]